MCEECGCNETIEVNKTIMDDSLAHDIYHSLQDRKIFSVNIEGSPGSGKTTVIEHLIRIIGSERIAVIQGDLESDIDKKRMQDLGVRCYQINTHSGCHLLPQMVNRALLGLNLEGIEFLFIENVGNLVCPAGVNLGQHLNLVVSSTAEGSDKPLKYPHIFHDAGIVVISKYDLMDAVDFDERQFKEDLAKVSGAQVLMVSKEEADSHRALAELLADKRKNFKGHHGHTH